MHVELRLSYEMKTKQNESLKVWNKDAGDNLDLNTSNSLQPGWNCSMSEAKLPCGPQLWGECPEKSILFIRTHYLLLSL